MVWLNKMLMTAIFCITSSMIAQEDQMQVVDDQEHQIADSATLKTPELPVDDVAVVHHDIADQPEHASHEPSVLSKQEPVAIMAKNVDQQDLPVLHDSDQMPKIMPHMPVSPLDHLPHSVDYSAHAMPHMVTTPVIAKATAKEHVVPDLAQNSLSHHGLDTINIDSGGNWLEKRIWYEKSEHLFEDIRAYVQKVTDLRMEFVNTVNQAGHKIDDFYQTIDFQKGQITELLTAVEASIAQEKEIRGGDLSSSERSLKAKVHAEKKSLEQLHAHLKLVEDLDEQVDKTMMKAFKEIDTCRSFETRAWNNFKEIGLELDDQKARVLYYEMENFFKNIEQKFNYLKQNLLPYLQQQLVNKVTQTIAEITQSIDAFKQKGLQFNQLLATDEKGDFIILQEREKEVEQQAEQKALKKEEKTIKKMSENKGLLGQLQSWITFILDKLHDAFCVVYCSMQYILCKAQQWACSLLGY